MWENLKGNIMPSATLLVAERNDLVGAARIALSAFPNVELVTVDAGQLLQRAASASPSAIIVPASGIDPDGNGLCRSVKESSPSCRVLVVVDDPTGRDAAMEAGADEILIGTPDADALRDLLGRLNGVTFTRQERAEMPLAVTLTLGAQSYPAQSLALSRNAMFIAWPTPPAVGTPMKIELTPYEGTTLSVWARVQTTVGPEGAGGIDSEGALVRFIGLTTEEQTAISYLVDYYASPGDGAANGNGAAAPTDDDSIAIAGDVATPAPAAQPEVAATARPAQAAAGASSAAASPAAGGSPAVSPDSPWNQLTETSAGRAAINESIRSLADADPEKLATGASTFSKTRDATALPGGITAEEIRGHLPKLAPAETSAMRGTSTMADLTGQLLRSAGVRLKTMILTARFKSLTTKIYDPNVQLTAEEATTKILDEAVQIHGVLNQALQERMKSGNMDAARDLRQVTTSMLQSAQLLEHALDKYIFGAEVEEPSASGAGIDVPHEVARYNKPARGVDMTAVEKPSTSSSKKSPQKSPGKKPKDKKSARKEKFESDPDAPNWPLRIVMGVILLACIGGTIYTYRHMLFPSEPPGFVAEQPVIVVDGVNIFQSMAVGDPPTLFVTFDATLKKVPANERIAFLEKAADKALERQGETMPVKLYDHTGTLIASTYDGELKLR